MYRTLCSTIVWHKLYWSTETNRDLMNFNKEDRDILYVQEEWPILYCNLLYQKGYYFLDSIKKTKNKNKTEHHLKLFIITIFDKFIPEKEYWIRCNKIKAKQSIKFKGIKTQLSIIILAYEGWGGLYAPPSEMHGEEK